MYLTLVVLFLICAIIRYVSQVRNSRIYEVVFQYPPCFRELPLLGSLYHFWSYKNSSEDTLKKIVEMGSNTIKAGGITRLYGPNMFYLVLTDASDIAEVLASYLNKDSIYNVIKVLTGNGSIFVSEHSISKVRRRAILPLLQPKFLTRYIEWTWAESVALTEVLAPFVGKGPFAAGHYLGAFCFNSIIRWGDVLEIKKELCTLKLSEDLQRGFRLIYERTSSLWMIPDFVYKHTANHSETHKIAMSFRDVAGKAIQMQKDKSSRIPTPISSDDFNENYKNNCALFDCLLRSHLTQEEIIEEIIVIMGASEEASLAIGFALTLLGQYPAVQDRLYEELVNIVGESDRPLEKEDVAEMPYLDSFVKEVLRLYQTVPLILRQAHKEIKLSSGRVIPEGAGIVVPMISLHRNPAYWGPDADHFDPERFLPERLAAIPDDAYIPFSSGQRSCPGYKLASYLVKLALCAILRRYKVVGTPAAGPVPHIRTKFEVVLRPVNNFEIELVNRI